MHAVTEAPAAVANACVHGKRGSRPLQRTASASGSEYSLACSEVLSSDEEKCEDSGAPAKRGTACKRQKTGAAAKGPTMAQLKAR